MPQRAGPYVLLPLSDVDLPPLARALVGHVRGRVVAQPLPCLVAPSVRLTGPGIDIFVRGDDWLVLAPKLLAGLWSPPRVPSPVGDLDDAFLYTLILTDLKNLFPRTFPTSTL